MRPFGPIGRIGPILLLLFASLTARAAGPRASVELTDGWRTALVGDAATARTQGPALPMSSTAPREVQPAFDDSAWRTVDVPHNWDDYGGATQVRHGNLHGSAWYRCTFKVPLGDDEPAAPAGERRVFLFFEGVGSYATVWVNGREIGRHAGGLTTFTLDATAAVNLAGENTLVVRADHPEGIRDLPWVCGGCERVAGFSEGPQPFGIFRPVHVVVTNAVRVAPFGVHVWNDADLDPKAAQVHLRTEVTNHGAASATFTLRSRIADAANAVVSESVLPIGTLATGETRTIAQEPPPLLNATRWKPGAGYLYRVVTELLAADGAVLDREETPFGLRTIRWPRATDADGRFFVNGEPVFLNGTCDYEHNLGANFAFTDAQVAARVGQIEAAGFNAFRDAHHPHNLRFNERWDRDGLLWWTQFGAQIWFDRDDFRANFRTLLRDWVKERRNSPSLVLWGLQNESKLPEWFAKECSAIIRELDPTASSQRLVTTCNGGKGTDWDVPQNWTGTYGGDPATYADDLKRQRLVGEYGAWRSAGLRDERGYHLEGALGEERFATLLGMKVRLGESVRDFSCGHFQWIFTTHANPGRAVGENGEQLFDGIDELDHIGPANNKGLFTQWGEPTDAFYMYRANYVPATKEPMVHLVASPWEPTELRKPGQKQVVVAYSNCDTVELFDDIGGTSLGVRRRGPIGTHFRWDDVTATKGILHAVGRIDGKAAAHSTIATFAWAHPSWLRPTPDDQPNGTAPREGWHYVYSVDCGGVGATDGREWEWDREYQAPTSRHSNNWGAISWAAEYGNLEAQHGSGRTAYIPFARTNNSRLFQSFRYGREKLRYYFPVPDGDYEVELYFAEPWYGEGGVDATGWRVFDVAVNDVTVIKDLDLFREAGFATAVRKIIPVRVSDGKIEISFPRVKAGQAIISGIAIVSRTKISLTDARLKRPRESNPRDTTRYLSPKLIRDLWVPRDVPTGGSLQIFRPLGGGDFVTKLSVALADCDWINFGAGSPIWREVSFTAKSQLDLFAAFTGAPPAGWIPATPRITIQRYSGSQSTEQSLLLYKRRASAGEQVFLPSALVGQIRVLFLQAARVPVVVPLVQDADGTPAWTISVGVGDRYGINFNYRNATGAPVAASLAIVQADGTTLRTEALEFPPSPAGDAWSILHARTGSSINAGTYRLRLTAPAGALTLGDLEVE